MGSGFSKEIIRLRHDPDAHFDLSSIASQLANTAPEWASMFLDIRSRSDREAFLTSLDTDSDFRVDYEMALRSSERFARGWLRVAEVVLGDRSDPASVKTLELMRSSAGKWIEYSKLGVWLDYLNDDDE